MLATQEITLTAIKDWLANKLGTLTGINHQQINGDTPLAEYGLDSMHAVGLSGDIEDWLGIALEPTVAWDYPTIDLMSRHVLEIFSQSRKQSEFNQKVA